MNTGSYLFIVLIVVVGGLVGAWCSRVVSRWWRRVRMQRRFRRGHKGEERARAYLQRNGYRILGEEVTVEPCMWIDGRKECYKVRADYLVEKKGVRGVFEVKTGKAANFTDRATRRQLREYAAVYDVDQVCLYDGRTDSHQTVSFDYPAVAVGKRGRWGWLLAVFVAGVGVGAVMMTWSCGLQ